MRSLAARILAMGGRCEQLIQMASKALDKRDADLRSGETLLDQ